MIFVDESIQQQLGYICVGFAYCEHSPSQEIADALRQVGLTPGTDEYKSGIRMTGADSRHELRDRIQGIVLQQCKIGVYIARADERPELKALVADTAEQIVVRNRLSRPHDVFVDEGMGGRARVTDEVNVTYNCDSRLVAGIQLADFVAYHCSYLLKCALTGKQKVVVVDSEPHPISGQEVELDWILRTDLRRTFFAEPRNVDEIRGDDWFFKVAGYGAFFSPSLNTEVRAAAEDVFGAMYLGCVW
jgi:hypothetical protein